MAAPEVIDTVEAWDKLHAFRRDKMDFPSEEVFRFLASAKDDIQTGKAVDVGCGSGRHMPMLRGFGFEPYGTDTSPEALDQAKEHGEVVEADMTDLPFEDGMFDVALCMAVAFYGDRANLFATMTEIRRVLRPGGHALMTLRTPRDWRIKTGPEIASSTVVFDIPGELEHGMTAYHAVPDDITELTTGWAGAGVELDEHTRDNMRRFESHYVVAMYGKL